MFIIYEMVILKAKESLEREASVKFVLMLLFMKFLKASPSCSYFQFRDLVHKFGLKIRVEMGKKTVIMRQQKQRNRRQVSTAGSSWFEAEEPDRREKLNLDSELEAEKRNMTSFEAV